MDKCKLAIFDFDGTIFCGAKATVKAVKKASKECGLSAPSDNRITSSIGKTMDDFMTTLFPNENISVLTSLREKISLYEDELLLAEGMLYPGIVEVLDTLNEMGYKIVICSNGSYDYLSRTLKGFEIIDYFDEIKGREPGVTKSNHVLNYVSKYSPITTIYIGDTYDDYTAANNNNIPFVYCDYGFGNIEPDDIYTVTAPSEIIRIIKLVDSFSTIESRINKMDGRVIGINGVDTSGKTTYSNEFYKYFKLKNQKVCIIHLDDFHNEKRIRMIGENPISAYFDNAFNIRKIVDEILLPIKKIGTVNKKLPLLDLDTDTYSKEVEFDIDLDTIVILEGVLLYREPIEKFIDLKIYIDISFDEVIKRVIKRDVPLYGESMIKRYYEKYIPIQKEYIEKYKPMQKSDILIDNEDYNNPKIRSEE